MTRSTLREAAATASLAAFASRLEYAVIPAEVIDKAKLSLLDTLGCCIYGSTLAPVRMLAQMAIAEGGQPVATILGTGQRTSSALAALVNGTAAHAFQLDEVHAGSTLHPGSVVVPALAALSEAAGGIDGRDFLAAMVAGYEVGTRIGNACEGRMFTRGWHNQGATGPLAAAAAAARALRLDPERTNHALGLAASQSAGLMAVQEGANAKAFHSGRAAQSGVYAALLARSGYTGIEDVLDQDYGAFFSTLAGGHNHAKLTAGLGGEWETLKVGYKLAPASNGSITAMATLVRVMQENGLAAHDIEQITAGVSTNTFEHCGWDFDPAALKGVLAAQMNLRYGLAVMALDRAATPAQFCEARIKSPDIAAFLPKIDVRVHAPYDGNAALRLACTLEVRVGGGRDFSGETLYRPGGAEDPIPPEDLERKFVTLTSGILTEVQARECIAYVKGLDAQARVAFPI